MYGSYRIHKNPMIFYIIPGPPDNLCLTLLPTKQNSIFNPIAASMKITGPWLDLISFHICLGGVTIYLREYGIATSFHYQSLQKMVPLPEHKLKEKKRVGNIFNVTFSKASKTKRCNGIFHGNKFRLLKNVCTSVSPMLYNIWRQQKNGTISSNQKISIYYPSKTSRGILEKKNYFLTNKFHIWPHKFSLFHCQGSSKLNKFQVNC